MRRLFRCIDEILRRRQDIREFWNDADCMFRISLRPAERALPLPEGEIPAGAQLLELHYWNEHLPPQPSGGPDLAWAAKCRRMLLATLVALAARLERSPELRSAAGVFGITTFLSPAEAETGKKLLARLGFCHAPYRSRLGAFGDFWENLYVWFLNRAYGGSSVRRRSVWELRRVLVWTSREELVRRYARGLDRMPTREPAPGRGREAAVPK